MVKAQITPVMLPGSWVPPDVLDQWSMAAELLVPSYLLESARDLHHTRVCMSPRLKDCDFAHMWLCEISRARLSSSGQPWTAWRRLAGVHFFIHKYARQLFVKAEC